MFGPGIWWVGSDVKRSVEVDVIGRLAVKR